MQGLDNQVDSGIARLAKYFPCTTRRWLQAPAGYDFFLWKDQPIDSPATAKWTSDDDTRPITITTKVVVSARWVLRGNFAPDGDGWVTVGTSPENTMYITLFDINGQGWVPANIWTDTLAGDIIDIWDSPHTNGYTLNVTSPGVLNPGNFFYIPILVAVQAGDLGNTTPLTVTVTRNHP